MADNNVRFENGGLHIVYKGSTSHVPPGAILALDECQMADEATQGDEHFHIVHLDESFWLIGPMVDGALGAVETLLEAHPELRFRRVTVNSVPWRMRASGWLGMRLWPIAGLGCFPISELRALGLREVSHG